MQPPLWAGLPPMGKLSCEHGHAHTKESELVHDAFLSVVEYDNDLWEPTPQVPGATPG